GGGVGGRGTGGKGRLWRWGSAQILDRKTGSRGQQKRCRSSQVRWTVLHSYLPHPPSSRLYPVTSRPSHDAGHSLTCEWQGCQQAWVAFGFPCVKSPRRTTVG